MFYPLAQKALFALNPERAHQLTLEALRTASRVGATRLLCATPGQPLNCMGLEFPNAVGVAPGLDKNADYFEALGDLGFGFVEVGTVTPRPQPGNPRPRVFRLPQAQALINRLGFNNKGVDYLVKRVRSHRFRGVLGINIGKNFDTPIERAAEDYRECLRKVYPYADYVTVNISSPNTANLRELQHGDSLQELLAGLAEQRDTLQQQHGKRVPLAVKVAPDLTEDAIAGISRTVVASGIEAVIATNTTIARPDSVQGLAGADQAGGLSGQPLKPYADRALLGFSQQLQGRATLIGVGGISCGQDAVDKLQRGASLVQFYTGMIYRGPALLSECLQAISRHRAA